MANEPTLNKNLRLITEEVDETAKQFGVLRNHREFHLIQQNILY